MLANLYAACQSRQSDLENFFSHENHSYPISLSEYGRLRKCSNKSDFLKCLEDLSEPSLESPDVEAKIVDGAAFVNINQPKTSTAFEEYCFKEIPQQVRRMAHGVSRLDFVFDSYIADSLKSQTRESRGKGIRIVVRKETPICKKFQDFMRNDQNKTFMMLAESLTTMESNFDIVVTNLENVLSNNVNNLDELFPCNHEKADTRIFLHAKNASNNGIRKLSIVTVDTDVVVVALYHFFFR